MRVLLTGGLGFVGSNLMVHLEQSKHIDAITIIDDLGYSANFEKIKDLGNNTQFIQGNICDEALINTLVQNNDVVINLAAEAFVDRSICNARPFVETNIIGIHCILEAIRKNGFKCRIIHVSTDEVWGDIAHGSFTEKSPYLPQNPYSATKAAGDHLIRSYGNTYDLNFNIVYFSNLYGPWMYPERLIPKTIVRILNKEIMELHGDGSQIRTWLHIDDAIRGLMKVLYSPYEKESFAFGIDAEHTNLQVVELISNILNKEIYRCIKFISDRPGQDIRYSIDFSKSQEVFNWYPTIQLERGLEELIEWYIRTKFYDMWKI